MTSDHDCVRSTLMWLPWCRDTPTCAIVTLQKALAQVQFWVTPNWEYVRSKICIHQGVHWVLHTNKCALFGVQYSVNLQNARCNNKENKWTGGTVEIQTHWKLTDCSMTAPQHVLSPSSILPPPSSHCAFIPARKNCAPLKKAIFLKKLLFLKSA
jgi:hypothetical protein